MQALDKLREIATLFEASGIDDPSKEAELLITESLSLSRSLLYTHDPPLSTEESSSLDSLAARRLKGEPLHYLIGHVEFCGLTIHVGPGVLIPRPETELLVEEATSRIIKESGLSGREPSHRSPLKILDLCTGSGCIALALSKRFPEALVYGTDRSERAIRYALRNASASGILHARFLVGDLFGPLGPVKFDFIVSNPPYIPQRDIAHLQREIRDYEPVDALDGGTDGLVYYRRIIGEAPGHLRYGGRILLEIGTGQRDAVERIALGEGFEDVTFLRDFSGTWRIFSGKRGER